MYKLFTEASASSMDDSSIEMISKWVYARYVRVHTHDIRALTVASPICGEGMRRRIPSSLDLCDAIVR